MIADLASTSSTSTAVNTPKLCLVQHGSQHPFAPSQDNIFDVPDPIDILTIQKPLSNPPGQNNGDSGNVENREKISDIASPTSSKRPLRKTDKSRVEKLMEEQINASTRLVTATENLVSEMKVANLLKQEENALLLRLVAVKEEEVVYKRMKYSAGEA